MKILSVLSAVKLNVHVASSETEMLGPYLIHFKSIIPSIPFVQISTVSLEAKPSRRKFQSHLTLLVILLEKVDINDIPEHRSMFSLPQYVCIHLLYFYSKDGSIVVRICELITWSMCVLNVGFIISITSSSFKWCYRLFKTTHATHTVEHIA